jgi:glucose/arabinose dehydrogenase
MRSLALTLFAATCMAAIPDLAVEPVWPGLQVELPVDLDFAAPELGTAYVIEQKSGRVLVFDVAGNGEPQTILDLSEGLQIKGNEEGLLALCLAPDFATSGVFYAYYTAAKPRRGVVSRFRSTGPRQAVDRASEELLLEVEQPWGNHNGADLKFGPDGFLYVSLGDGGAANDPKRHGQDLQTLLGSVLRLDVSAAAGDRPYAIPAENPFVGRADARPEIWCYGLRNPWRMAFDRATGALWCGDVGQNSWEEVDILIAGGNYGWNAYEGSRPFAKKPADVQLPTDHIPPVFEYDRSMQTGGLSITGGFVYRGQRFPALQGVYLCADYASGNVWGLDAARPTEHRLVMRGGRSICSFAEDPAGELYVVEHRPGRIARVEAR